MRAQDGNSATHAEAAPKPAPKPAPDPKPRPSPLETGEDQEEPFDRDNPNLPTAIAVRRKGTGSACTGSRSSSETAASS
ncbi:hypothetical protein Mext_0130 [Methylorubrum extorquens PA1]|nr:hypothetical protein Mext_0130 [Methylorubrum extorquens PA1]